MTSAQRWTLTVVCASTAVFQLTAGSLADRFGRRKLFVIGVCLFTLASALCTMASSSGLLIAARALQGLGAAVMFRASLALLAQEFEGDARDRDLGRGLANPLATFTHLGVLPPGQGGLASGINNTARQLGLAVGIAVLGAVLQSTIDGRDLHTTSEAAFASGLNELLLISVVLALIGLAAALVLVRTRDLWRPEPRTSTAAG